MCPSAETDGSGPAARPRVVAGCFENGLVDLLQRSSRCPVHGLPLHSNNRSDLAVCRRPLVKRLDAVKEILHTPSVAIEKLKCLLKNQPDMQRGLSRIQYGKVSSFLTSVSRDSIDHSAHS